MAKAQLFKASLLKKKLEQIVWVLDRVNKNANKRVRKMRKKFVLNKYQSVTYVSTFIFQGFFKKKVYRSVALVTKNVWAILDFSKTGLFSALYPTL